MCRWRWLAVAGWILAGTAWMGCNEPKVVPINEPAAQEPMDDQLPLEDEAVTSGAAATAEPAEPAPPVDTAAPAAPAAEPAPAPAPRQQPKESYAARRADAPARTYVVKKGDTLQKISMKFYGTTQKWRRIYQANRDQLKDGPNKIVPGQKLVIP